MKLHLDDVAKILKNEGVKKIFLGGYEPTIDPHIIEILSKLKSDGFWIKLVTNGELLNKRIIGLVDELTISIKAVDDEVHKYYTGVSNKKTLENFEKYCNLEKIELESIYIPEVVECEEILRIAEYIAKFNKNLRYRIDRYLSYGGYGREATEQEVEDCFKKVKKILPNVYTFASCWGKPKNRTYPACLYPSLNHLKK